MNTLTIADLPVLYPLLKEALPTYPFPGIVPDPDYTLSVIHKGIEEGICVAMVDDIGAPKAFLIGAVSMSNMFNGKRFCIAGIYIQPAHRSLELVQNMMASADEAAKKMECKLIYGSSWMLRGSESTTDKLWKFFGFEEQEMIYTKAI